MQYDPIEGLTMAVNRLTDQMDKQNDKIDEVSKEMRMLVANQVEIKELRESQTRMFRRLELVENNQNTDGCQAHKNFIKVRDEQLKKYDTLAENCEEKHDEFDARLKAIEDLPKKRIEVAIVEVIKWATIMVLGLVGIKLGVTK